MGDRNAEARRVARELVNDLGSPINFTVQLFLLQSTGIVVPDHVFIVQGKIKGLLRYAVSSGGLALDPYWPSIDVAQTAESLFSQKAVDVDMHINQTVARHFSSRVDPAMVFLPVPAGTGAAATGSGGGGGSPDASHHNNNNNNVNGHPSVTAKYFSKDGLFDVVGDLRMNKATGILMEYRAPMDGYHNLLRATFTPFLLVMEMRQCGIPLKDNQVPLKYRVSTGAAAGGASAAQQQQQQMMLSGQASSPASSGRNASVQMHGRYNQLHHHGRSSVEVPVPQSASTLVCDMLKALIDKREEGGEFVERCVAYFSVISPKQVVFLWCSQINAMPLDHANQLSEAVTSLSDPHHSGVSQQQQQQQQQHDKSGGDLSSSQSQTPSKYKTKQQQQQQQQGGKTNSPPPSPHSKRLVSPSEVVAMPALDSPSKKTTPTTDRNNKSAAAGRVAGGGQQQQQQHHNPMDTSHHHYYEKKHDDESEFLSHSLIHDMNISPARDQDISAHSAYLKEQSIILRELPGSMTAMRETSNATSSLARIKGAYHQQPPQQQQSNKKKEKSNKKDDDEKKQHDDEVEEEEEEDLPFSKNSSCAGSSSSSAGPDPSHIRALATAAAARRVARVFGVDKKKLPQLPAEMKHYNKPSRDLKDYSAARTETSRVSSLRAQRRQSRILHQQEDEKMEKAFEKAKLRREKEEQRLHHHHHDGPGGSGEHDATRDGDDHHVDDISSEDGSAAHQVGTTAMSTASFISELPSAARAVKLMKDSEFDVALHEIHEQTNDKFDTGMAGYIVDMPAPFLFSKFLEEKHKNSERKGVLEELLAPGALRAQKRKERKARDAPPLELREDDGMSFLEKTVSSKLSGQLLSSQLIDRRNLQRRIKQQQQEGYPHQSSPAVAESPSAKKRRQKQLLKAQQGGATSISALLFEDSGDEPEVDDEIGTVDDIMSRNISPTSAAGREQHQQRMQRIGSRGGSSGSRSRSRQNSGVFDLANYFSSSSSQQQMMHSRTKSQQGQDQSAPGQEDVDYDEEDEDEEAQPLYPTSALSAPAAGLSQDEMAKYTYTVRRIRALGQVIFSTAADLLYRSASRQPERRNTLEVVIPFGFRHLDQELRSVFHTLGLEEQSLDSIARIAEFRDQHDSDGTSFGELALNTQIGEAESMFEDESLVRQSNGAVASVRDEWYSLEGGGSVVFLLRDAKVATSRVEKRLVSLEAELTPLTRFDGPLCTPKDVDCCKRLCELVAERGFTICDAANVVNTERKSGGGGGGGDRRL